MTQYRVLVEDATPRESLAARIEETLQNAASSGWELVNVFPYVACDDGTGTRFALVVKQ